MTDRLTADKPCLPPYARERRSELIGPLLREVSRSFYLTLRVLPRELRPQISLAYLLARATDTIADTDAVPRENRRALLEQLRELKLPALGPLLVHQALPAEKLLLERLGDCLAAVATFSPGDQQRIAELLSTIVSGQIFDLDRFPGETLVALKADEELDQYTYLVAGCVGRFWTRMCAANVEELSRIEAWKNGSLEESGVRFGKGLQLVNVLRDVPRDLRLGRCYLPVPEPDRLLDPRNYEAVRPEYQRWLDTAVAHLDAGWRYTLQIPRTQRRLRLACIWPIWIGLETIARLRRENPLDPARRIRISRAEVYRLMLRSMLQCGRDGALNAHYQRLRQAASQAGA